MKLKLENSNNSKLVDDIMKKSSEELSGQETMRLIPIEEIDHDPKNKDVFNMREIESIRDSIKDIGFFGVIEVRQKENGRYEIISGHRRFEAAKLAGEKKIRCLVTANVDELTRRKRFIRSNTLNRKMTPLDWAHCVEYYRTEIYSVEKPSGKFRNAAAAELGISSQTVYRYECILRCIPELQKYADDMKFPYRMFESIATLNNEEQIKLYNKINEYIEFQKSYREKIDEELEEDVMMISAAKLKSMITVIKNEREIERKKEERRERKEELKELYKNELNIEKKEPEGIHNIQEEHAEPLNKPQNTEIKPLIEPASETDSEMIKEPKTEVIPSELTFIDQSSDANNSFLSFDTPDQEKTGFYLIEQNENQKVISFEQPSDAKEDNEENFADTDIKNHLDSIMNILLTNPKIKDKKNIKNYLEQIFIYL